MQTIVTQPKKHKRLKLQIIFLTFVLITFTGYLITYYFFNFYAPSFSHLKNIKLRLEDNEELKTQQYYPEGAFFSYAIYGSTWINIGLDTDNSDIKNLAQDEALWAITKLESEKIKHLFAQSTEINHGIFYLGWINRLYGGVLLIDQSQLDSEFIRTFHNQSEQIAQAFQKSKTPFLASYPDQTWPVDNIPALSSLVIHDQLFKTSYRQQIIAPWKQNLSNFYDVNQDLIPHQVDSQTGEIVKPARGASSALLLSLLPDVDQELSNNLFDKYQRQFSDDFFISLSREYPKGIGGKKNTNSGPIVFGYGAVASITNIATLKAHDQYSKAHRGFTAFDLIGLPTRSANDSTQYLFGKFLLYDIFLTWADTHHKWTR